MTNFCTRLPSSSLPCRRCPSSRRRRCRRRRIRPATVRRRRSSTRPRACRGRARTPSGPGRRRRRGSAAADRCENATSHTEPSPSRRLRHDRFLHERAVLAEDLNAVVAAVADVDLSVLRDLDAADGAELLRRRPVRIVRTRIGVAGRLRRTRPSAACRRPSWRRRRRCGGCRSRRRRRLRSRRRRQRRPSGGASRSCCRCRPACRPADLQQELPRARELQDVRVLGRRRERASAPAAARAGRLGHAGRGDPDVALASTAMPPGDRGHSYPAPGPPQWLDECAGLIELEHRRRRKTALVGGRRVRGRAHLRSRVERVGAAVDDPDVVLRVDRDAGDRAEEPVIRQRLGPERVDLEASEATALPGRGREHGRRRPRQGPTAGPARALRFIRVTGSSK